MRHRLKGKKLNRNLGHRRSLYRNLIGSLIEHESIKTTLTKANAIKPLTERLVTVARRNDLAARRRLLEFIYSKESVDKLLTEIAPRFRDRKGGYTRIVKIGPRKSDKAEMAKIEFISDVNKKKGTKKETKETTKEKSPQKSS